MLYSATAARNDPVDCLLFIGQRTVAVCAGAYIQLNVRALSQDFLPDAFPGIARIQINSSVIFADKIDEFLAVMNGVQSATYNITKQQDRGV